MRLSVASLRRMVKAKPPVELVRQELTSYSGQELLRCYVRPRDLPRRLRAACPGTGGDYGGGAWPCSSWRCAMSVPAARSISAMSPAISWSRASAG